MAGAQEDQSVSIAGRHRHRPTGVQAVFPNHKHADRERSSFDHCLVDAAIGDAGAAKVRFW